MIKDIERSTIWWSAVKIKVRIARGQAWFNYLKDIAYVFIVLYFIEDILKRFGIDNPILFKYLYIIFPILYYVTCYIVGYVDEIKGIWKLESIYSSKELNPFFEKLDKKIDNLDKKIDNLDKKIDNLEKR